MNYSKSNNGKSPYKQGKLSDIVGLKRSLVTKVRKGSDKDNVSALTSDLVRILAGLGIIIKNMHTIATLLSNEGWVKLKKIKRDGI